MTVPPLLLVMAAGRGTRYGGPKQLEPVGPSGETLIDYALADGRRAGFARGLLVTHGELEPAMRGIASRHAARLPVTLTTQSHAPGQPYGTVAAVLAGAEQIDGPFAVLNADDFYGAQTYQRAFGFLTDPGIAADEHAVVTLPLGATLSPHGQVVRAICDTDGQYLTRLDEVHGLELRDGEIVAGSRRFNGAERVSMNFWAFQLGMVAALRRELERLAAGAADYAGRDELPLPVAVDALIASRQTRVRVLDAHGPWLGLTHASDLAGVRAALRTVTERGDYPSPVWKPDRVTDNKYQVPYV